MNKHLNNRRKLRICNAYTANAMEYFLSSIINATFSDALSAKFIGAICEFDSTQRSLNFAPINAFLLMYPNHPEKYKIPNRFIKSDGAIDLGHVHRTLQSGTKKEKVGLEIFNKEIVHYIYDVFTEDGIGALMEKIREIQVSFGCYGTHPDKNIEYIDIRQESDNVLIFCMLELIKTWTPKIFFSDKFQKLESWHLTEQ